MSQIKTARMQIRGMIFGRWMQPWKIQEELGILCGIYISESSVTRRIRELREPRHGSWNVQLRPASKGSAAKDYCIPKARKSK